MKNGWTLNDAVNAVCPGCDKLVTSRFEYRTVTLSRTRLRVRNVLVDVCPECDTTIHIPRQSIAQLREAGVAK
jgi:uncharacterized protein YbbK (DUF523 family)